MEGYQPWLLSSAPECPMLQICCGAKMNLAGWLHPHYVLTCPEAIQRLVRERDNLFRRQGLAILGGVSIASQQHVVAGSNSPADCCIYTILRLAPGDDQAFDAARLQLRLQTRLMKGIR